MLFLDFLINAFAFGITFLYGSTGEIITEKAGHLNLGIPGIMGVGGACGCAALNIMCAAGNLPPWLIVIIGLLAAFAGGALMGLLYSFLTVTLRSNQNVTGLAMTIFGIGLTKYLFYTLAKKPANSETPVIHYLKALDYYRFPFAGQKSSLVYCGIMVFLGIAIAIVASIILTRTRVGLHLRAVGDSPATADAAGINVTRYKYVATIIGSGIAALGGLFYIMDYQGSQEAYLSIEAMGWLSVALVIFSLWRPYISIFGSFVFGALFILASYLPVFGVSVNMATSNLIKTLPYVVTILVLIVTSIINRRENQPPASLGVSYFREDR